MYSTNNYIVNQHMSVLSHVNRQWNNCCSRILLKGPACSYYTEPGEQGVHQTLVTCARLALLKHNPKRNNAGRRHQLYMIVVPQKERLDNKWGALQPLRERHRLITWTNTNDLSGKQVRSAHNFLSSIVNSNEIQCTLQD